MEETRQIVKYLDTADLTWINLRHIQEDNPNSELGGRLHNLNSFQYLIEIVKDDDHFPTLEKKAALYCFNIITRHIFLDGNKRTGMAATLWFLERNNAYLEQLSDDNIVDVTVSIATGDMVFKNFVKWIQERIQLGK